MPPHELSIVIPVLNDTEPLRRLLTTIHIDPEVDIVVVNGGAPDDRLTAICDRPDVRLLTSTRGRGCQMNAGASAAVGRWIVFLHADTRLPPQWSDEIRSASADPGVVGGSFRFRLASSAWQARLIERAVDRRVRWLDLAYGDQALFVRRDVFEAMSGYREWPLMEDVDFVRRLRQAGKLYHSPQPVLTSARRWERDGWWRRSARNVMLQGLFFAGMAPERLANWYSPAPRDSTRDALVVMARVPSDTRGKSRLTRDLGGDHVQLRRALLQDTLDAVRGVGDVDVFIAFEPAEAIAEMRGLAGDGVRLFPQQGDTLGDRMRNAFERLFAAGYSGVVMIGSDLPSLPASYVARAFQCVRDRRDAVVFGPASDGGYYLIGLRRLCPTLFTSVAWSTADVLTTTTSIAERCGLTVSFVSPWHDVDTVDDLRRVLRDPDGATRTRAWVNAHSDSPTSYVIHYATTMVDMIAEPVARVGSERALVPLDEANRQLLERVGPRGWINPQSRGVYDLVVVGGGTAGLVSAIGAAGLGARVAVIERGLLGGDCLTTGCVPSKALLRSARAVGELRRARGVGICVGDVEADFASIMRRMRERRAEISAHDSIERMREAGVDLFFGHGRFTGGRAIEVDGQTLTFNRAVIATGSRPAKPPLRGLDRVPYLTSETVFSLTELPRRLLVVGAGPIGCELAQAFACFGSAVTVFDVAPRVLPNFDADAASIVHRRLAGDGVTFHFGVKLTEVIQDGASLVVRYEHPTGSNQVTGDQLLIADGRTPNVDGLGLDVADVAVAEHGIVVDDRLRTSNRRIYAAGDVCSRFKFTHAADALARVAIQNALFLGRRRASSLVIPRCVYTDPEVADVGMYENEGRHEGRHIETITIPLSDVDRAIIDDETDGFVRLHHNRGRLLGATIVATHAGDLIAEPTFALTHGLTLADLARTIHAYPTQSQSFGLAGDASRRSRLTPRVRVWLERYFRWTR